MRLRLVAFGAILVSVAVAAETLAPLGTYTDAQRRWWAFIKPAKPEVPKIAGAANPIDAFLLAELQKAGLKPSPAADKTTLIRRVYFDLIGLPPTPAEVAAFVSDPAPDAYSKLVDKLLNDPRYGERWGQHWLDVVRFAETDGFEYDTHRNDAWRYRDYVIRAFNNDKPYDRFVTEQLAGDELSPQEQETLIASGFNRLGPVRKNAGNQLVASSRNEVLTEMTNIVGAAYLGVTIGCARCHDHKFDPFKQSDYYRLQAFFAATTENDIVTANEEQKAAFKLKSDPVEEEIKKIRAQMQALRGRKDMESLNLREVLNKQLEEAQEKTPTPLPSVNAVKDATDKKSPIHVLPRGDYEHPGDRVGMRPPGIFLPDGAPEVPEDVAKPRLELAKWVTNPENPLPARVMVNRIWEYHFGQGIVATPNDFGRMGTRPSHPELLDWLANEFVASGWSIKHMHRLMMNTNAYKQSSANPANSTMQALVNEKDPSNKLLWRANRRRLDAEEIRDAILAVSGQLNPKAGGPSIMVPIDEGLVAALYKPSQWQPPKDTSEYERRSVYLINKRNLRLPFLEVFDQPDGAASCPRREQSTHAPQALELMNGDFANQHAEAFAKRLEREAGPEVSKQIDLGYRLVTGRAAKPAEIQAATEFLKTQPRREFALVLLNLNSFLYVN